MTAPAASPPVTVQCRIVGGGPAGMMLGALLARAGVPPFGGVRTPELA
jgi:cation diffusion facilitator CzcD-associated flavoprotein CzcO